MVIVDTGKKKHLDWLTGVGGAGWSGAVCRLFTNSPTINHSLILSGVVEGSWTGYAGATLSGWPVSTLDATFHAQSQASEVVFNNTSGSSQTVIGYFITDAANTVLIGAENFATPLTLPNNVSLELTLTATYTSEF